ncbi:hypothetical protein NXK88_002719 [Enterococcus hirae]|uniref:hypothetical protein n=1 Tax=Enterococcus hirae TaxID=1354 RepID=UPI002072BFE3|nr:hypothetical protein [Enterococcus hirae]EMF0203446.1 hypothetical protein [Enterococcus hirae]
MQWLDPNIIKNTIISIRKKEFGTLDDPFFQEQLVIAIEEIKKYRNKGRKIFFQEEDILKKVYNLLEIEAIVLSIIDTLIYSPFEKNFYFYLEQNKPFVYRDYFDMVSYYSSDFSEFSFLAMFYLMKVKK